ncbi:hypothetical protein VHEMI07223 [[Torrubiella] hemipterigena]|uniref:Peptidase S8/S53 domain-containing protein n=1 Tax=[Torrubiella] hemipterigena TaxID=1531966 RepID=A0A0A1TKZ4_9HYPO|nr:hypothetical protein VHEMI07223 [[Torrubiella] hemipterigena]
MESQTPAAEYTNYGNGIDIFGPRTDVLSVSYKGDDQYRLDTGTSMATPDDAGVALTIMSVNGVGSPGGVTSKLLEMATKDAITGELRGSPNVLVNNGNTQQAT